MWHEIITIVRVQAEYKAVSQRRDRQPALRAFLSLSLYLFLVQSSREISFRPVPFFHSRNIILVCTGSPRSSTHVSQHFDTFEWIDAARPVTPPLRTVCSSVQVQRAGFILSRSSVVTISIRSNRISDRRIWGYHKFSGYIVSMCTVVLRRVKVLCFYQFVLVFFLLSFAMWLIFHCFQFTSVDYTVRCHMDNRRCEKFYCDKNKSDVMNYYTLCNFVIRLIFFLVKFSFNLYLILFNRKSWF